MPNNPKAADNLKPFKKGDPRINRKGKPRSFDALRALAQQLAHEVVETKQGNLTAVEVILRQMAKDPKQRVTFLEYAFGKVPTNLDVTSGGEKMEIVVKYATNNRDDTEPAQ